MKKTYVKPALVMESFVLSQNIAYNCGVPGGGTDLGSPGMGSRDTCGWIDSLGRELWLDTENVCDFKVNEDYEYIGVCYNSPSNGWSIFGS